MYFVIGRPVPGGNGGEGRDPQTTTKYMYIYMYIHIYKLVAMCLGKVRGRFLKHGTPAKRCLRSTQAALFVKNDIILHNDIDCRHILLYCKIYHIEKVYTYKYIYKHICAYLQAYVQAICIYTHKCIQYVWFHIDIYIYIYI